MPPPSSTMSAPTRWTCLPGRVVYTQMLNAKGGIESDLTVTRLSETAFLLVVPGATLQRDLAWLRAHLGDRFATITDMTAAEAVFCVMGPKARNLLQECSPDDLTNEAFPFGTAREIEIGMGLARAHRISYVGELGWELYVSTDQAAHVFETLTEAGAITASSSAACTRSTVAASKRPSAISAMTSPTRITCWRPASALPCARRNPISSVATPSCANAKRGSPAAWCSSS
jgi:heterotetrameric sarcosine oxidase gamma subunit